MCLAVPKGGRTWEELGQAEPWLGRICLQRQWESRSLGRGTHTESQGVMIYFGVTERKGVF